MGLIKPIDTIRYIIACGCLIIMFFNLFDVVIENRTILDYIHSVLVYLIFFLYMILTTGKTPVVVALYTIGTITMIGDLCVNNLSYAIVMYILAIFIERHLFLRFLIYFTNLIISTCIYVFYNQKESSFVNYIMAYIIFYTISECVYLLLKERFARSEDAAITDK